MIPSKCLPTPYIEAGHCLSLTFAVISDRLAKHLFPTLGHSVTRTLLSPSPPMTHEHDERHTAGKNRDSPERNCLFSSFHSTAVLGTF